MGEPRPEAILFAEPAFFHHATYTNGAPGDAPKVEPPDGRDTAPGRFLSPLSREDHGAVAVHRAGPQPAVGRTGLIRTPGFRLLPVLSPPNLQVGPCETAPHGARSPKAWAGRLARRPKRQRRAYDLFKKLEVTTAQKAVRLLDQYPRGLAVAGCSKKKKPVAGTRRATLGMTKGARSRQGTRTSPRGADPR